MNDATLGTSTAHAPTADGASNPVWNADAPTGAEDAPARPATSGPTAKTPNGQNGTAKPFAGTTKAILSVGPTGSGSAAGDAKAAPSGQPSLSSSGPRARWNVPHDVMELVAQANTLATDVLNGEASLPVARTYASIARSIAGLLKAEIERRRYIDSPELTFPIEEVRE